MRKILIIGFDALSWEYMDFLISRGNLPNFSSLRKKSVYGPLESVYPPGTYIAWPTFLTGVNPAKHSLFYPIVFKEKFNYQGSPSNTSMIEYPTFYEIISDSKFTVGVVNHPGVFPPISVNGFFISHPPSPYSDFAFPKSLRSELLAKFPDYGKPLKRDSNPKVTIKNAMKMLSLNWEVSKYCFGKDNTDIKSTTFMEVDIVSHWYWDKPELIDQIYMHCDKILGEIIDEYGDEHDIMVLSDHGFGRCLSIFHPNVWLEKIGLLKWKSKSNKIPSNAISNFGRNFARGTLKSLGLYDKYMRRSYKGKKQDKIYSELSESIDWNHTKIYFREDMGFRFNIMGREKQGILSLSEANNIFEKVNKEIVKLEDPDNFGLRPFKGLIRNAEVFSGPHIAKSPDFYIDVNDNYHRGFSCKNNKRMFEENVSQPGKHSMNGIFLMSGKGIKENIVKKINIIDLIPQILFLLKIESRKYFDGKFQKSFFTDNMLSENEYKISEDSFSFSRNKEDIRDEDRESITEFWKDVGYL